MTYFGLRDYQCDNQIGLEQTPDEYVNQLVNVFREVKRVLRDDGTLWLNLGDSYSAKALPGYKPKDLIGIPWLVAFALRADGWYLRQDIIWAKKNCMPESVKDRCCKSHEYIFLLSKSSKYYYDQDAIKEVAAPDYSIRDRDSTKLNNTPGRTPMQGLKTNRYEYRNKRSVWTITTKPRKESHFAIFPMDLIRPCILAGCPLYVCAKCGEPWLRGKQGCECTVRPYHTQSGTVLDCFGGSGTVGEVSEMEGRNSILIELNPKYIELIKKRTAQQGLFANAT